MYIVCIWGFKSYWGLVKRQRRHVSECMLFNKTSEVVEAGIQGGYYPPPPNVCHFLVLIKQEVKLKK